MTEIMTQDEYNAKRKAIIDRDDNPYTESAELARLCDEYFWRTTMPAMAQKYASLGVRMAEGDSGLIDVYDKNNNCYHYAIRSGKWRCAGKAKWYFSKSFQDFLERYVCKTKALPRHKTTLKREKEQWLDLIDKSAV